MTQTHAAAMIGTGGIARKHAQALAQHKGVRVVAVADTRTDAASAFVDQWFTAQPDKPAVFADYQAMLRDSPADLVVICTPHTMHFAQTRDALEAGAHVLVEKPMVTSVDEALALGVRVGSSGRKLRVGYNTTCSPRTRWARDTIKQGGIGDLLQVHAFLTQRWKAVVAGTWRADPALSGGGQAYDSGAHLFASLLFIVDRPLVDVFAVVDNAGTAVDINASVIVRFEGGVTATVAIGGECPSNTSAMHLMGRAGQIDFDPWGASRLSMFTDNTWTEPTLTEPSLTPVDHLIDCIENDSQPIASVTLGLRHAQLMQALYESARLNRPVPVQR